MARELPQPRQRREDLEPALVLEGRSVVVVEDIVDTGLTMAYLRKLASPTLATPLQATPAVAEAVAA